MSMNRDYNKLVKDYQTRFYSAPPPGKNYAAFSQMIILKSWKQQREQPLKNTAAPV